MKVLEVHDVGAQVNCDLCNESFTIHDMRTGGILVQSKAVCPECAPKYEADLKKYGETHLIRGRCPTGMPFHVWVMGLRQGDNKVVVTSYDNIEEFMKDRP